MHEFRLTLSPDTGAGDSSGPGVSMGADVESVISPTVPTIPDRGASIPTMRRPLPIPSQDQDKTSKATTKPGADASRKEIGDLSTNDEGSGEDSETSLGEKDKDKDLESRFDRHPRFQQLHEKVKKAEDQNAQLIQRLSYLEGQLAASSQGKASQPAGQQQADFVDITTMKPDEITDKFMDDPLGFLGNFARQIKAEISSTMTQELSGKSHEDRVRGGFQKYADENPGFLEKWNSGEISRFIEQNPHHGPISAYHELTKQTAEEAHKKALEDAVKAAEQKVLKQLKAKQGASVLGSGPSATGRATNQVPDELVNPQKYGGKDKVLVARHLARMSRGT